MTELEIDQSHLPRVQEVCQGFAVLEDGALAHNLQEQEIEQYYSSNIQNSQLVQKDIRMARKLQEEEEEERAKQRALLSHATRQLEEQDSEYARRIQDEIQRCVEQEARRRELEDEEIAKRIQEEEEQRVRSSCVQEPLNDGAGLTPKGACLDMGELQQVLLDEELARRLQEEEGLLLQRSPHPAASPLNSYPEGDFRVAQVAQDEEIARFMQKQEMKSKHQSRELDVPESWRDPRGMAQDRRPPRERERLDSEGLPSPTEACSLDQQPTIPTSTEACSLDQQPTIPTSTEACSLDQQPTIPTFTKLQAFTMRNIAEDLDPTFRVRRQSTDSLRVGETSSGSPACQSPPACHSGHLEKPAFIPPTKRHSDKSARGKSKEKGNCKQQ